MSESRPSERISDAFEAAWAALPHAPHRVELPDVPATDPSPIAQAAHRANPGTPVFVMTTPAGAVGVYRAIRDAVVRPRANLKVVAIEPSGRTEAGGGDVNDLGVLRGLPGLTIAVPADGPSVRSAVGALAAFDGPAYLRLAGPSAGTVSVGPFQIGRAPVLRDGSDLTVVAIGPMVARALDVARDLAAVGVSARVLDFASFKPHDEKALLRAARETGAILTLEPHSVLTGLGALVAAAVAEEAPVPVRRVGLPDLFGPEGDAALALDRCLEEAWTLLRAKGKVQ